MRLVTPDSCPSYLQVILIHISGVSVVRSRTCSGRGTRFAPPCRVAYFLSPFFDPKVFVIGSVLLDRVNVAGGAAELNTERIR
ncbi:MAG TPA: hypothetical protein VFX16_22265 [Pseudonocardiaceae bacterium]|nr:hypothetical protein [Pseudonocardiaceae bacterium]